MQAHEAYTNSDRYFLTLEDVGYKFMVGVEVPGSPMVLCTPVGPIEQAPPRVRYHQPRTRSHALSICSLSCFTVLDRLYPIHVLLAMLCVVLCGEACSFTSSTSE